MLRIAISSIKYRAVSFMAAFVSMLLGAVIVMTFASLIDVSTASGISAAEQEHLLTMAAVVGGCGLIIVLFSVTTTMTLTVRQRGAEIALLKSVGATPPQIRRMISAEAAILAMLAAVPAIPLAMLAGRALRRMLVSTGLLAADIPYRFGIAAVSIGIGVTVAASVAAAWLTARKTAGMGVAESLLHSKQETPRIGLKRAVAGWIFLASGVSAAAVSALVLADADISILQIVAGEASLLSAIGLALLAPGLVRTVGTAISRIVRPLLGVSGHVSALNVQRHPHQMSGSLVPIILLTAVATGTLYTQQIDDTIADAGGPLPADAQGVQALNYTVVGMLCVFAAIMLVNSLIAATVYRREEFAQYRLIGLTSSQITRIVNAEQLAIVITGIAAGALAGLLTIIPYSIARTDTLLPDITPTVFLATIALVAILTFGSSLGAAHKVMRRPAIQRIPA